jgi:hypothetical protein
MAENERAVRESRRGKYKREQPTELSLSQAGYSPYINIRQAGFV